MFVHYLELLQRNETEIKTRFHVKRIGLFGSARFEGKQVGPRDVDVLVEFETPNYDAFIELSDFLEKIFHKKVDLVTVGGLNPYFGAEVMNEVIWCE